MSFPVTYFSRYCVACHQGGLQRPLTLCWVRARMVDAGDIFAQIDAAPGMVRFLEDPEAYDSAAAVARIDNAVQRSMALSQRLQAAHRAVRPGPELGAYGHVFAAGHGLVGLLEDSSCIVSHSTFGEGACCYHEPVHMHAIMVMRRKLKRRTLHTASVRAPGREVAATLYAEYQVHSCTYSCFCCARCRWTVRT